MNKVFKKALAGLTLSAAVVLSSQVNAATIIDDWYLDATAFGGSKTLSIGHLTLGGGFGSVNQDYGADFTLNAGDTFTEFGQQLSLTYTPENSPGGGDTGLAVLGYQIDLNMTGLTGTVASVSGTTIEYVFDSFAVNPAGNIEMVINGNHVMDFALVDPSGGEVGDFHGGVQVSGSTDLLLMANPITDLFTASIFGDTSTNTPYEYFDLTQLPSIVPTLLFDVHTTNTLDPSGTHGAGIPNVIFNYVNGVDDSDGIISAELYITSEGSVNLVAVPEPASLALLGIGLLGFGAARRRKS